MHSTSTNDQRKAAVHGAVIGGVDVAQGWHDIQGLLPNGLSAGKPMRFDNTRSGFDAMWARRPAGARLVMGLESTGPYWLPLAHWLRQQPGVTVVLVNPLHTHKHTRRRGPPAPSAQRTWPLQGKVGGAPVRAGPCLGVAKFGVRFSICGEGIRKQEPELFFGI